MDLATGEWITLIFGVILLVGATFASIRIIVTGKYLDNFFYLTVPVLFAVVALGLIAGELVTGSNRANQADDRTMAHNCVVKVSSS